MQDTSSLKQSDQRPSGLSNFRNMVQEDAIEFFPINSDRQFFRGCDGVKRIINGFYTNPDDFSKRPLTKFRKDLLKDGWYMK